MLPCAHILLSEIALLTATPEWKAPTLHSGPELHHDIRKPKYPASATSSHADAEAQNGRGPGPVPSFLLGIMSRTG